MDRRYENRFNEFLIEGISALKDNNLNAAESFLTKAARANPHDSRPWIWLTETTEDLNQKIDYMESAVAADPSSATARRGLAILKGKIQVDDLVEPDQAGQPDPDPHPEQASTIETHQCPNCGAQIVFSIEDRTLVCKHCGFTKVTKNYLASQKQAGVLDFALPTQKGHTGADAQVYLTCEKCSATSIWPPGQTSLECPYCLSSHLVETKDTAEFVEPAAIGLFKFEDKKARQVIANWFRKGLTVPDDLVEALDKIRLTHAYYPFWAIDGTLEFKWRCEVNEGSNDAPNWKPRSGTDYEIFDRILISGTKKIPPAVLKKLGDFHIKDLLTYQPQYLAGWPAITYEVPLSEASLDVRERVSKKVRRELYARIEPHEEKRNLSTGTLNWRDMTYKLVYLPIYTGLYRYRKQDYHLFINGISGAITGEKPRNRTKVIALILAVVLSVVLLFALALIVLSFLGII